MRPAAKRSPARPRVGLALGSGVARGWAHIGVLRELDRIGVRPDIVCGTSIGAFVGANYAVGRLDEFEAWTRELTPIGVVRFLDISLGSGGLFGGRRLHAFLEATLGDRRIEDLDIPFAAVATDLTTGHEVWIREGRLADAVTASYALPGAFAPVRIDDRWLVDGALVNPVPVSVCRALGARLVIAVNLNADLLGGIRMTKGADELTAQIGLVNDGENGPRDIVRADRLRPANFVLRQLFRHDTETPGLLDTMSAALNIIQDRLCRSRLAGDPPDVMVMPRLSDVGPLDFHRAAECIEEGREAVERVTPILNDAFADLGGWPGPGRRRAEPPG